MGNEASINSGIARDRLYGMSQKQKKQVQDQKQQQMAKQDPSVSGLQWAKAQSAQASQNVGNVKKPGSQNVQKKTSTPELVLPDTNDVAMLSSAVSTKQQAVEAPSVTQKIFTRLGINTKALKGKFKDYYRQSKSHNLLLERFMANVKMSGLNALMSLAGVSPDEISDIKAEVREEAYAEIDSKIKDDYCHAKVMIKIVGGGKKAKGQMRVLEEIKNQLVLQADRWGRKGHYSSLRLIEMEQSQCGQIRGELLSERSNLEYELHILGSNKKDVLAKIDRLKTYVIKADRLGERYQKDISRAIDKMIGDRKAIKRALSGMSAESSVSVVIR
ncbi:MAG: hypothetical protein HQ564_06715 [Candidatus Saganbacteria bacterium]|nr:hypothetical protein [Candidatus Saganbacteria bacterium]